MRAKKITYKIDSYDSRIKLTLTFNEWFENFIKSLYEKNIKEEGQRQVKVWLSEKMENVVDKYLVSDIKSPVWQSMDSNFKVSKWNSGKYTYIYITRTV